MRDLARDLPGKKSFIDLKLIKLAVIIVLVLAVVSFVKDKVSLGGSSSGGALVLSEAPRGLKPVSVGEEVLKIEGGVDLKTQNTTFRDVKYGGKATGTASRSFGGGLYVLSIEANLPDPVNTHYQVWAVGGGKVVAVDTMRGSKTDWSLTVRTTDKYSSYSGLWITLERNRHDGLPEEHVLEASF